MNNLITIYIASVMGSSACSLYMKRNIYHQITIKDIIVTFCPILNFVATVCLIMCMGCDLFLFIMNQFKKRK